MLISLIFQQKQEFLGVWGRARSLSVTKALCNTEPLQMNRENTFYLF